MKVIKALSLFLGLALGLGASLGAVGDGYEIDLEKITNSFEKSLRDSNWEPQFSQSSSEWLEHKTMALFNLDASPLRDKVKSLLIGVRRNPSNYGSSREGIAKPTQLSVIIYFKPGFDPSNSLPELHEAILKLCGSGGFSKIGDSPLYYFLSHYNNRSQALGFLEVLYQYELINDAVVDFAMEVTGCQEFRAAFVISKLEADSINLDNMASFFDISSVMKEPRCIDAFVAKICSSASSARAFEEEISQKLDLIRQLAQQAKVWPIQASLDFLDFLLLQDFSSASSYSEKLTETRRALWPKIMQHDEEADCAEKLSRLYSKIATKS